MTHSYLASTSAPVKEDPHKIPACPTCKGDGCRTCAGTGLTASDYVAANYRHREHTTAPTRELQPVTSKKITLENQATYYYRSAS